MKIKKVTLKDFRRFTDLTIEGLGPQVKLVVLLGQNGSGKSSVFDAFSLAVSSSKHGNIYWNSSYYSKINENSNNALKKLHCEFHDSPTSYPGGRGQKKDFYFRSAYRHDSLDESQYLRKLPPIEEDDQDPRSMANLDTRTSENYQRLVSNSLGRLFEPGDTNNISRVELRDTYLRRIRDSMIRVFGDLVLEGPGRPLDDGTFLFKKGLAHGFKYINLSGGEKAAFDLLLDFVMKSEYFNDTIYCLDEPELHIHSALQGKLLVELLQILPEKCQLWIATHSAGMIRKAKELYEQNPNNVAFLDFSDRDFDYPQTLRPLEPSRLVWKKAFEVSLGDLVSLIAPQKVIFCEGQKKIQGAKNNVDFDSRCYNTIFSKEYPDVQFVSVGGCKDVESNATMAKAILQECVSGVEVKTIFDRDDYTDEEIADIKANGGIVLSLRDIENYLWDDEVLQKFCESEGNPAAFQRIQQTKNELMHDINPSDDVKRISGPLYVEVRKVLNLRQCGNTHVSFTRDKLAPLITSDMEIYKKLRQDIFGI